MREMIFLSLVTFILCIRKQGSMENFPRIGYRAIIFYNFRRNLSTHECHQEMETVFGENCPSLRTIERWYLQFNRGDFNLEDDMRSGRPADIVTPENISLVENAIKENRHITYAQLAEAVHISERSVGRILHDHLHVRKLCSLWVPHMLTEEQRAARVNWCRKMIEKYECGSHHDVSSIVTGDETWLYYFDVPTKSQSKIWVFEDEEQPTQVRKSRSVNKRMVATFFKKGGLVTNVVLEHQKTVTATWYTEVCLPQVIGKLKILRPNSPLSSWHFHHDNAPAHRAYATTNFLRDCGLKLLDHPAYSPDLAPCDFGLFPYAKAKMKGRKFASEAELLAAWDQICDSIDKEQWQRWFNDWFRRMEKCIAYDGKYFEKQ